MDFIPAAVVSAASQSSYCPAGVGPSRPSKSSTHQDDKDDSEAGSQAGIVLQGGSEEGMGEGSYRLKRRFEAGSHGEVQKSGNENREAIRL